MVVRSYGSSCELEDGVHVGLQQVEVQVAYVGEALEGFLSNPHVRT